MSFSLRQFDLPEMLRCGLDLRRIARPAEGMEAAAEAVVRYFHDIFVDPASGERECALVRFYVTHPYGALPPELQAYARERMAGREPWSAMKCLVLLATAGREPAWNSRHLSRGHRAIPLPSVEIVEQAPMIAQLVRQMGLDLESVVSPQPELLQGLQGKTYNVFYVPEAGGSHAIPAQDEFVRPYGIRSVLGCGGVHVTGELYAAILFSRVPIPQESADRFRNIALDLKMAISAFREEHIFGDAAAPTPEPA
ncbi:MAG TPA: hypothetical protein VEX86_16375 [Longimicrobium sp.]|nr:hypothetical protein [Longimicrobium sp.]